MQFGFWETTCAILIPGVLLASWIDYSERRVPNWLNAALIVIGATTVLYTLTRFGLLAMFAMFSLPLTDALIAAHERGVKVRIVVDRSQGGRCAGVSCKYPSRTT